ncbi:SgrR family transcriptional regulator [Vibrio sp. Isolate23]|uniref:ABC transporter substrate-binding protein n=1 Tax=Vibrio sp. Isolate23 TaxID=2908533 RepID=UPI001EFE39AA|nr:SgrR family transcriptional regulator [Vibrio sp. Isolate23]
MNDVNIRYLELLLKKYQLNQVYSVGLGELETVLCTSRRNVSTVMGKLANIGWVYWQPAVGRGKSSKLKVKKSLQQVLSIVFLYELEQAQSKVITKLLESYGLVAIRALSVAAEEFNERNEQVNSVFISSYPWVNTIDPAQTYRASELQVIKSVYDVLIRQDQDGSLLPGLAHHWEQNDNVISLWLRPLIYRHDGELLAIEDVVWSLERLRDYSGPVRDLVSGIETIDITASDKVEITLNFPNKLFIYALAMPYASIICRDQLCFGNGYTCHVGTGPYKVDRWNEESLSLKAHNDYYAARALIEKVTLSHNTEIIENALSFNQEVGEVEVESINAFSYLTYHERADSELSLATWDALANYIAQSKYDYDEDNAVEGVDLQQLSENMLPVEPPKLKGRVVIAEPIWTIPSLIRNAKWLHRLIRSTGLELDVHIVEDISHPEAATAHADLMLIEEIVEAPLEYGLFEWLSISTGLRFALNERDMEDHQQRIRQAVSAHVPLVELQKIEQELYESKRCVALFCGKEEVTKVQQVRGVQIRPTGYSDFYKLWISK